MSGGDRRISEPSTVPQENQEWINPTRATLNILLSMILYWLFHRDPYNGLL